MTYAHGNHRIVMDTKEEQFIELYSVKRLNEWKAIASHEKCKDIEFIKRKYNSIWGYIAYKINATPQEVSELYSKLKKNIADIQKKYNKFNTKERKEGFKTFEDFLSWYNKQRKECYYCKTSEETIKQLFQSIFKPQKDAWKYGTLQIDRKKPKGGYSKKNCVLACVFCNNAKSDLITDDDFIKYFKKPMSKYLKDKSKYF